MTTLGTKIYTGILTAIFTVSVGFAIGYWTLFMADTSSFGGIETLILAVSTYLTVQTGRPLIVMIGWLFDMDLSYDEDEYYYEEEA